MTRTFTPADAQALADRVYAGDAYETTDQRLFALLVDVAAAYEASTDGGGPRYRDTNLLAVRENLDAADDTGTTADDPGAHPTGGDDTTAVGAAG